MPSWGEILLEFQRSAQERAPQGPDTDGIRLRYIQRLREISSRAVIVYASGWLKGGGVRDFHHLVEGDDVHALMEVCNGVPEREADLIIHSPGGSAQAAEQMMNYLRTQFDYIRAFVPLQAKSAATMMALGADEIVMGRHSELGPIDPQIFVPLPGGVTRPAPAHAILRDFERAKREIAGDTSVLAVWTPILATYSGGLIEFCHQQIRLSQEVVAGWLKDYMLSHPDAGIDGTERDRVAQCIAEYFGSEEAYDRFRTHERPIRVEELEPIRGLRVRYLESDDELQDAVLSIYHALDLTFNGPAIKIVENHLGARYVTIRQQVQLQVGPPPHPPQPGPVPQEPANPQQLPSPARPQHRKKAEKRKKRR